MSVGFSDRKRFALAVLLLVALPIVIGLLASPGIVHWLASKWERFILLSSAVFIYVMRTYWKAKRDLRFWVIYLGFVVIHLCGIGYFFWTGGGLPFPIFELASAGEAIGMGLVLYWILGISPGKVNLDI